MIKILKLSPIDIDGCSVGVCAEDGTPIMKPWRILVSSESTWERRCRGTYVTVLTRMLDAKARGRLGRPSIPDVCAS